jgi:hypothetical protein
VPYRAAEQKNYERTWPIAWDEIKLGDYLALFGGTKSRF